MTTATLASPAGLRSLPLLSYGFRPFFLAAALWAPVALILWIAAMTGQTERLAVYGAVAWHAHELLYGYVSAVIAGFLLTAAPNWTGRPPIRGAALLGLLVLWIAGRLALLAVDQIGLAAAIVVDSLFLAALALTAGHEIVAARNWRNLRIVAVVAAIGVSNVLYHLEVARAGAPQYAGRLGVSLIILLIMVIGGRITPSFTRNWLIGRGARRYPALFDRLDGAAVAIGALALALWTAAPDRTPTALALLAGAAIHAVRLARWRGGATWREPLVLILHLGYAFVPLGFLTTGLAVLQPEAFPPSAALHAWTAGAIAVMTLGVMTRVSLGHTGRALTASPATSAIYVAAALAALLRLAAPLSEATLALLIASAGFWTLSFAGFLVCYGPFLLKPRPAGPATC